VNVSAFRILLSEWQTSSNPSHVRFSRLSLGFWKILDSQTISSGITLPSQEMRATRCICIIHERIQVIDEHATHLAFLTRPGETKSWKRKKYIYIYIYIYIYVCMYVCISGISISNFLLLLFRGIVRKVPYIKIHSWDDPPGRVIILFTSFSPFLPPASSSPVPTKECSNRQAYRSWCT